MIVTEEEYFGLLDRIVKGSRILADPLLDKDEYDRYSKLYDELVAKARAWRVANN
jgi:hypothetical protein